MAFAFASDVKQVACGRHHTLVLTASGAAYGLGRNVEGQLGCGELCETRLKPCPLDKKRCAEEDIPKLQSLNFIAAGSEHSAAISKTGELYTWGENSQGRLGHRAASVNYTGASGQTLAWPWRVKALENVVVRSVALGARHTIILDRDGKLYACGAGERGRLGLGPEALQEVREEPVPIASLDGLVVTRIACGGGHSVAGAEDGRLFTWGANDKGQLGNGSLEDCAVPNVAGMFGSNGGIAALACGMAHTMALTGDGSLLACGDNRNGQLGAATAELQSAESSAIFQAVGIPDGCRPVSVACGAAHTIVKARDSGAINSIVVFGNCASGQLGTGQLSNCPAPVRIHDKRFQVMQVYAGSRHTAILVDQLPPPGLQPVSDSPYDASVENWCLVPGRDSLRTGFVGATFNDFNAPGWAPQDSRRTAQRSQIYTMPAKRPTTPDEDQGWEDASAKPNAYLQSAWPRAMAELSKPSGSDAREEDGEGDEGAAVAAVAEEPTNATDA